MKIAFFHELTSLSGARKVVEEYGKILGKEHKVDLYYVDEIEDKKVVEIFSNTHYFKFNSSKFRVHRDFVELIDLYFLHKKIAGIINGKHYDLIFISPSKFTQAPYLLRFIKNSVYFCQEPLRLVYDPLMAIPRGLSLQKKAYEFVNRKIRKIVDKKNIDSANLVLVNSEFSRDNVYKAYAINAKVCYLGVDVKKFSPRNVKKIHDLLFIGDKSTIEGFDLFEATLKAYKRKPTVRYIMRDEAGQGIAEDNLTAEINRSKIALSLSRGEPFGLIPIEAMSCGVAVIAVSEGGLKESVVDGVTGYLINRSTTDLKEKIDLLLKNDSLRNKLGKNSRERVLAKFTWEESVNRFWEILSNAGYFTK